MALSILEYSDSIPASLANLLQSLAALCNSQLALVITQRPELASLITSCLHQIAVRKVQSPFAFSSTNGDDDQAALAIAKILSSLIERGDPSLARKLVPTPGAIIDLAVCSHALVTELTRSVLARLLDPYSTAEILGQLFKQLQGIIAQADAEHTSLTIGSFARILAAFLAVCPLQALSQSESSVIQLSSLLAKAYDLVLPAMASSKGGLDVELLETTITDSSSWQLAWLTAKVDLLQASSSLLQVTLDGDSPLFKNDAVKSAALLGLASESASNTNTVPLLSADLIQDLSKSFSLIPILGKAMLQDEKAKAVVDRIKALDAQQGPHLRSKFAGPAWAALQNVLKQRRTKGKGKATEAAAQTQAFSPDETMVATVNSILPHLEMDQLRIILSRPSFKRQSAEEVIQRLLEGDQGEVDIMDQALPVRSSSPTYVPPERIPSTKRSLVKSRNNIFDDEPLDLSKASWSKRKDDDGLGSLSSELKAAILARAEANSDDEEEEWNPFAELGQRTVGVEDELELDYKEREISRKPSNEDEDDEEEPTGLHRRMATVNLGGSRPIALDNVHFEDDTDEEEEQSSSAPPPPPSGAEAERAAERSLIRHYSKYGASAFMKDPATRKTEKRKSLKRELESLGGRGWDDSLIESWAVMFERNPRKSKLLASANDVVLSHPQPPGEGGERHFGPDRSRGGRIMRGGGSGRGGGSSRGKVTGNSGNDRAAKMKEKRGNQDRKRGFDKKMARGAAGAAI